MLISADSGAVLWEKNAYESLPMASTTKIMTALLGLEAAAREDDPVVEVTEEMVMVEGSAMGLTPGDRISLRNLCAGMLMASGNDAANTVALYLDGGLESFARRMNLRGEKLGLQDTHFVTPSGLDADGHASTARDMAMLARAALKNADFREICSHHTYQVEFIEPEKKVTYTNHNKLLEMYDGYIGVKTGFTKKAGRCLVSAAERGGVTLICVTLDAPDDWNDHTALLDYGFSTVTSLSLDAPEFPDSLPVVGGDADSVSLKARPGGAVTVLKSDADRITAKVFLPRFVYAPVDTGDKVGTAVFYLDGRALYSVPVTATRDVGCVKKEPGMMEKLFGK